MEYAQTGKTVSMAVKLDEFLTDNAASFDAETIIKPNDDELNDWMIPGQVLNLL